MYLKIRHVGDNIDISAEPDLWPKIHEILSAFNAVSIRRGEFVQYKIDSQRKADCIAQIYDLGKYAKT